MSVDEVALELGVSTDLIYRAVKRDEIPHVRVARRVLIPRRWLEELFDTSAAAVGDALLAPPGTASASGTAGSTAGRQTPTDDRVHHLAGGTPGPVSTRKTGT